MLLFRKVVLYCWKHLIILVVTLLVNWVVLFLLMLTIRTWRFCMNRLIDIFIKFRIILWGVERRCRCWMRLRWYLLVLLTIGIVIWAGRRIRISIDCCGRGKDCIIVYFLVHGSWKIYICFFISVITSQTVTYQPG